MNRFFISTVCLAALVLPVHRATAETGKLTQAAPNTILWDGQHLARLRNEDKPHSGAVQDALNRLRRCTKEAKQRGPFTVTAKDTVPPSGDIHDYQSFSRYWWPNPETEDGLPYIRQDGKVNRKLVARGDREPLGEFCEVVQILSLAYFLLDDDEAGIAASNLVDTWFLDDATCMNPNLNFAQGVPGRADGRGAGIIDARKFMWALDAVELLDESVGWTEKKDKALQAWFLAFGKWLGTSPLGIKELNAKNNHGSWYDAQVARYALFAGNIESAKRTVESAKQRRIGIQFREDGLQPEALKRTLSLHYSMFNLSALVILARVGDQPDVAVDLWSHTPEHGCGLECAHTTLIPYIRGDQEWEHQQISPYRLSSTSRLTLRHAAKEYGNTAFEDLTNTVRVKNAEYDFTDLVAGKPLPTEDD